MTDIEVAITNIGEIATREIAKNEKPIGLSDNRRTAKRGGGVAKKLKIFLKKKQTVKLYQKKFIKLLIC